MSESSTDQDENSTDVKAIRIVTEVVKNLMAEADEPEVDLNVVYLKHDQYRSVCDESDMSEISDNYMPVLEEIKKLISKNLTRIFLRTLSKTLTM